VIKVKMRKLFEWRGLRSSIKPTCRLEGGDIIEEVVDE
jgi:hypothetical protein